ncbi:hypothetical protein APICC_02623 [Apis cerana cerana]|uniref:Uncharacterized protein n=1 Tax=Apis cerana cerana TaxID=94128 RepID=A0A2A3ERT3_APICC|nr:hypothetical protein APICC_02623 [Apis cerana cerana]
MNLYDQLEQKWLFIGSRTRYVILWHDNMQKKCRIQFMYWDAKSCQNAAFSDLALSDMGKMWEKIIENKDEYFET